MGSKSLEFEVSNETVVVTYEEVGPGRAKIPTYRPPPDTESEDSAWSKSSKEPEYAFFTLNVDELRDDIDSLMPNTLSSPKKKIQERFYSTLENHIEDYGRLLYDDLVSYIDLTILVMRSIDRARGVETFDDDEAREIFQALMSQVTDE